MTNLSLYLLLLFSFNYLPGIAESTFPSDPRATNFIRASCRATRYPDLCVHCLAVYANKIQRNEQQLAQAALAVSLAKARSTVVFVSKLAKARGVKPREHQAVRDCFETMGDTVDQLSRSIQELSRVGGRSRVAGQDFLWHMSNVQTWVSAALTDENTCLDGFSGAAMNGNVKAAIRRRVVYVAQVTSNALALVNRFASQRRAL